MSRSVDEWIGKTDEAKIPPRVRLRVFERHNGVCHISGRRIRAGEPWECDHIVALVNGGEHRESNLAPALVDKHREKTKGDVAEKSRVRRKKSKMLGIKPASRSWGYGKSDRLKMKIGGGLVDRRTGQPVKSNNKGVRYGSPDRSQ
ncbi:MAG: HNH endonuclease [Rhizobiales bacterium]|nr:HNH endonuclease [Hyphomicrobiales bacterium]